MAYADYADDLATAHELINETGETCTWTRPVPAATAQPWNPDDDTPLSYSGIVITWVPSVIRNFQAIGLDLSKLTGDGFLFGLMAGDVPFIPTVGDVIIRADNSSVHLTAPSDVVQPDGRPILYLLRCSK